MRRNIVFLMVLGMICWVQGAWTDEVCLTNGNILEGVVVQETDKIVKMEVFPDAWITFSAGDVAYVKKWDDWKNHELQERWLKEKQQREEAELIRQEFETRQRAKGLVEYKGKWISEDEKDKRSTREYIDQVLKSKREHGEIADPARRRSDIARIILAKGSWQYRQTEHFIIYYEDMMQSKIVADRCEYYYEKIAYDLNYEEEIDWSEKCEVFIVPSEAKWNEYLEGYVQRLDHVWGFVPGDGRREIYLCALSLPYLSVTFPHELAHLIFGEFARGKYIPLWLNEGLAIYESGIVGYADELLRNKVKAAGHIPLKELIKMKGYPKTKEEVELYYAQAEKITEFLITQHGRKKFSQFCRTLISGRAFAAALDSCYGDKYTDQDAFKRAWIMYILR